MSLQALLAARAHQEGKAQSTALYRHRAIADDPLCIVAWQLGAEPYSPGALAFGRESSGFQLYVPGYPLQRDLLFAALLEFAKNFCPAFEAYAAGPCEYREYKGKVLAVPLALPQIVVANDETIRLIGRLGRRLAYLSTTGQFAADPLLPRLGRHFMWIANHAHLPGQQLILSVAGLLGSHYATAMSALEVQSLTAMDAWVAPPSGIHGFHAAELAEDHPVGPVPKPKDGEQVHALMQDFNKARAGSTDPALVKNLAAPLFDLYGDMVEETWSLIWKVINRERHKPEAGFVARRVGEDRLKYAEHLDWMMGPADGRRKARLTPYGAAVRLNELESSNTLVAAEEAIDDPLRMLPHLLTGKALAGIVLNCNPFRTEVVGGRNCKRPSVTIRTEVPCQMPGGTELWWTSASGEKEWLVAEVTPSGGGSEVTLILQTNRAQKAGLPAIGVRACFSQFNTRPGYELHLPSQAPWTHQPAAPPETTDLEYNDSTEEAA